MLHLHRVRRHVLIGAAILSTLSACGGGGSDSDTNRATLPPPSNPIGLPSFAGDWLENGCVSIGSQSFKRLVRAADAPSTGITGIAYAEGVVTYPNTTCSGAGSLTGPSNLGTVAFSRWDWTRESSLAALWGTFTTITNTKSQVIWVGKGSNLLCLLGDQTPSILPDINAVAASLKTLPALGCFTRL